MVATASGNLGDDLDKLLKAYNSKGTEGSTRMTSKQSTEAAKKLGFVKTNFKSHGQPVFRKGNTYITPDVDSHNGGVWKVAGSVKDLGSKLTRWGTFDEI